MKDGLDGLDRAKQASGVMQLRVVGAGLPHRHEFAQGCAGAPAWRALLSHDAIPGHPFELGAGWDNVLAGGTPDWDQIFEGYVAAVDWPASLFWRELSAANPAALVLLSVRNTAQTWWRSADEVILPYRAVLAPD